VVAAALAGLVSVKAACLFVAFQNFFAILFVLFCFEIFQKYMMNYKHNEISTSIFFTTLQTSQ